MYMPPEKVRSLICRYLLDNECREVKEEDIISSVEAKRQDIIKELRGFVHCGAIISIVRSIGPTTFEVRDRECLQDNCKE